jgi:hypothetical protein
MLHLLAVCSPTDPLKTDPAASVHDLAPLIFGADSLD